MNIGMQNIHHLPQYGAVVKMALSLSHSQADVERGFSINKQVLNDRTMLSERALCATRTVKEVFNRYGSITSIPITPSLLFAYINAYTKYNEFLESKIAAKVSDSVLGKRKLPVEDTTDSMLQAKKRK